MLIHRIKLIASVLLFFVSSCNSQVQDKMKTKKGISSTIDIDAPLIKINLLVKAFSKDSIEVESKFTNTSSDSFCLYKNLLPGVNITEDVFSILSKKSMEYVNYTGEKNENYFNGSSSEIILVEPEEDTTNVLVIGPGESISFFSNVAKFYSFSQLVRKGDKEFSIIYAIPMPFIEKGKHVWKEDITGVKKPVYYFIQSDRVFFNIK